MKENSIEILGRRGLANHHAAEFKGWWGHADLGSCAHQGDKSVGAGVQDGLKRSGRGGKINGGCIAGHIDATGVVRGDAGAVVVVTPSQVGGVDQSSPGSVHMPGTHERNTDGLVNHAHRKSQKTAQKVDEAIQHLVKNKEKWKR